MITSEEAFAIKQEMQKRIEEAEKELQVLIHEQQTISKVDELALSFLRYEDIEQRIENYAHLFAFFSAPVSAVLSPLVKAEVLEYVRSAASVDPELGRSVALTIVAELRVLIQSPEDDELDMVESEYKVYVLPALLLAGLFSEANDCVQEMVRFCAQNSAQYGQQGEPTMALVYACEMAIDMAPSVDALISAVRVSFPQWLSEADQAALLDACEERLAEIRFETTKRTHLAHEKAVEMLERREMMSASH